jgi:hypothetical protein
MLRHIQVAYRRTGKSRAIHVNCRSPARVRPLWQNPRYAYPNSLTMQNTTQGEDNMRRILIAVTSTLCALVAVIPAAQAVSAHFIRADVTSVSSDTLTVAFKEAGLGNSLDSVTITVTATAECINPGSHHPKAANKESFSASGVFSISNGQATGSLTVSAASISPPCSPPMVIAWTDIVVSDPTFNDSISIPGTFFPSS